MEFSDRIWSDLGAVISPEERLLGGGWMRSGGAVRFLERGEEEASPAAAGGGAGHSGRVRTIR